MKDLTDVQITVNGQPLSEFLEDALHQEIEGVRVNILVKLNQAVHHSPKTARGGTGSGRTKGNPGVRRARVLSRQEVEQENARRGLVPFPGRRA